jgi:retron-type reverse transcriptase
VNFILDADIRSFFTEVSQEWVVRFLEHRIGDNRILRLVQKWLRAGVLEDGAVTIEEKGTGQGSVISPLLANVYLSPLRFRPLGRALATARGHGRHDHGPVRRRHRRGLPALKTTG